jgi:tRNA pseudouridine38-40 synthase
MLFNIFLTNIFSREHIDPSSKRYIMKFECLEPFVEQGLEFVECRVKGQSFMMHQIRKMVIFLNKVSERMYQQCFLQVAVAIAVVKGLAEPDLMDKAYGPLRLDLPMAPGLGLVLQEVTD